MAEASRDGWVSRAARSPARRQAVALSKRHALGPPSGASPWVTRGRASADGKKSHQRLKWPERPAGFYTQAEAGEGTWPGRSLHQSSRGGKASRPLCSASIFDPGLDRPGGRRGRAIADSASTAGMATGPTSREGSGRGGGGGGGRDSARPSAWRHDAGDPGGWPARRPVGRARKDQGREAWGARATKPSAMLCGRDSGRTRPFALRFLLRGTEARGHGANSTRVFAWSRKAEVRVAAATSSCRIRLSRRGRRDPHAAIRLGRQG